MQPEPIERALRGSGELGAAGTGDHRPPEQRGRLALRDGEVVVARAGELAATLELERLGGDHVLDHREHVIEQPGDTGRSDLARRPGYYGQRQAAFHAFLA